MPKPLYKTTIIIWSEYDGARVELSDLARQADEGDAYCTTQQSELIAKPDSDPDYNVPEGFFGDES